VYFDPYGVAVVNGVVFVLNYQAILQLLQSAALREAAENATFTLSEAACGLLDRGPHRNVEKDAGCESVTEQQLDQKVRNIITHHHFLELSSRRIGRRLS
jgi:hypothetical protein